MSAVTKWNVDASHTHIGFAVKHMVFATARGSFGSFSGTLNGDVNDLSNAQLEIEIDTNSIDTRDAQRDEHLRSGDFFDVENYPKMTFKSTKISRTGDSTYDIEGDLTIRDVTRSITLATTFLGQATNPWGVPVAAFDAETKINRKDFGLTWNAALETGGVLVGEEVTITIHAELNPASDE